MGGNRLRPPGKRSSQITSKKTSSFDLHTPRTKAAEASRSEIVTAVVQMKAGASGRKSSHDDAAAVKAAPAARRFAVKEP